ncbi:MAG: SDR family NAD(P)-dependent oxidoreductase [Cyclobacteriaceae bacterium]
MLAGKTILITGGAGSLGSNLVERLLSNDAIGKVIIYSRDELKHHYMSWRFPVSKYPIDYMIGDVRDLEKLTLACKSADIVIHTAALKQISTCEDNPEECYKTNVVGTQNIIKAVKANNVKKVLFISTDKAVEPTSVYGNSKQAGERLITNADSEECIFATVRLGNLLGSAGSVIPFFMEIKHTGEIPITHPEMTRFGGTMQEGADACLYALENMRGGEIFIPRWKSFSVGDLAQAIAPECRKKIIGSRKHEKMHEQFFAKVEISRLLENKDYYIIAKEKLTNDESLDLYRSIEAEIDERFISYSQEKWTIEELSAFIDHSVQLNRKI